MSRIRALRRAIDEFSWSKKAQPSLVRRQIVSMSVADVHIRRLREKLEQDPAEPEHIMTKWGVGYYFKG